MSCATLAIAYGDAPAVWDASLEVGEGEVVAVIGPNGAGKSTLNNAVAGLSPACRWRRISRSGAIAARRAGRGARLWSAGTPSSRFSGSGAARSPVRSPAASSRWWRSAAPSWPARAYVLEEGRIVVIIGGLANPIGALLAGLLIGVSESLTMAVVRRARRDGDHQ